MGTRHVGRLISMVALSGATSLVAASCGSSATDAPGDRDASMGVFDGSNGFVSSNDAGIASSCTPTTCAVLGFDCGVNADGCGGTIDCGSCSGADTCGVGGFSKCGNPLITIDGGLNCTPKTCADLGYDCGKATDGCNNAIDCNAAPCSGSGYCGGGGFDKCGGDVTDAGGPPCTPATCASLGYNCGVATDGCGGVLASCGPCTSPLACGAGKPNVCGTNVPCTGLCLQQAACPGGTPTTITGRVRAGLQEGATAWVPAGTTPDPVPGVLVYIPTTPVTPFDADPTHPQVQCSQCGADVSGAPLVSTTTNFDGTFTLTNVPVSKSTAAGDQIPIVIQLGRWRRQFAFTISNSCAANPIPDLHMPSTSAEGDIPLTAISTGSYDSIECVLLKMGVAQSEFTSYSTWSSEPAPAGGGPRAGRVHIYTSTTANQAVSDVGPGATLAARQDETVLLGTGTTPGAANGTYRDYDQILLPCWGDAFTKNAAELGNLIDYGNNGGRFFATHYSYSWLRGNGVLDGTAQWDPKANTNNTNPAPGGQPFTGDVSVNVPSTNPGLFVKWLNLVGALNGSVPGGAPPANPTVTIQQGRHDVDKVLGSSTDWIDGTDPAPPSASKSQMLLHFTFDMPIGQTSQCGHAIYSDFHVNGTQSGGTTFPAECDTGALTAQERILEYLLWDLASCVPGPPTSTCTPKSCADLGLSCGPAADGCGNLIPNGCGSCPTGQACGVGGTPGVCQTACKPETCADQGIACGPAGDGCGGLIQSCGMCPAPATCGGGGVSGQCGGNQGCIPKTCQDENIACGPAGDGCGGLIPSCGVCAPPTTCGGGGTPGQCGTMMAR